MYQAVSSTAVPQFLIHKHNRAAQLVKSGLIPLRPLTRRRLSSGSSPIVSCKHKKTDAVGPTADEADNPQSRRRKGGSGKKGKMKTFILEIIAVATSDERGRCRSR